MPSCIPLPAENPVPSARSTVFAPNDQTQNQLTAKTKTPRKRRRGMPLTGGPGRIYGLDLARGIAILGMFTAHTIGGGPAFWNHPSTWMGLVNGRSSILFALLAGVSLGIMSGRQESTPR